MEKNLRNQNETLNKQHRTELKAGKKTSEQNNENQRDKSPASCDADLLLNTTGMGAQPAETAYRGVEERDTVSAQAALSGAGCHAVAGTSRDQ